MYTWDVLHTNNIQVQLAKLIYLYNSSSVQITNHILTKLRPTCILDRRVWTKNNLEHLKYPLFNAFKRSSASTGFYDVC